MLLLIDHQLNYDQLPMTMTTTTTTTTKTMTRMKTLAEPKVAALESVRRKASFPLAK